MARPVEYDRDTVLSQAIRVFARHGYEAASTRDLTEGMGMARQSLYGAFGDKHGLFLEALRSYSARSLAQIQVALNAGTPCLDALEAALLVGLGSAEDLESGCLGLSSIMEFSRSDPDVSAQNDLAGRATIAAFAARIGQGIEEGEVTAGTDPDAAGRLMLTLRSGLKIAARAGATNPELRATARLALSVICARAG